MWYKIAVMLPQLSPAVRRSGGPSIVFLVWHDLVPTEKDKLVWFDTPVALFEAQLRRLEKAGAHPVTLGDAYRYLSSGAPTPPPRAIVLCFDDNTDGIFQYAAPRLQKRGWPFVVSAHTGYVGVRTSKGHNTYPTLRRMEQMGAAIVCQTHTHPPDLRPLGDAPLTREMQESKRRIEAGLGHAVSYLTYPSGKWDDRVAAFAQRTGYRMALTEDYGRAERSPHLLGIRRFSTHRRFAEAVSAIR